MTTIDKDFADYQIAIRATPTPDHLGGFQHITEGTIQKWDLMVTSELNPFKQWAELSVGRKIANEICRVYRKIPVCAHLNTPETREAAGFGEASDKIITPFAPNLPESWAAAHATAQHQAPAPAEKARTLDDGKPALAHVPTAALVAIAAAQAYGARKYGDFNNFRKGMEVTRNLSCALRHIYEFLDGSDADHESGLNPLDHAIARLAFVLQNLKDGTAIDDRHSTLARTPAPKGAA